MPRLMCISLVFFVLIKNGKGGDDHEVEQVKSPYVEARDLGRMMEHGSQSMQRMSSTPSRSFSTYQQQSRLCRTCQYTGGGPTYGTNGMASHGSSYSYGGGSSPVYSQPSSSSSRYEMEKKQEFVNGQKVYDFHHEKEYKDGKLVDEKRHEKNPEDLGVQTPPVSGHVPVYSYGTSMTSSSASQPRGVNKLPYGSHQEGQQYSGSNVNYGSQYPAAAGRDEFSDEFELEIERMREELRRKTMISQPVPGVVRAPSYSGGSHRSEYRTQTKYVNGKPVYSRNEQRKYENGKLVHDVVDEKGPEELGTSGIAISQQQQPSQYPGSYSSHYSSEFSNTDNTETAYRPPTYGSSSQVSASSASVSSQQQPYYRPSSSYSSEFVQESKDSQRRISTGYNPDDSSQQSYGSTSYYLQQRPDTGYPASTTTTTTTERPRYNTGTQDYSTRSQTPYQGSSQSQRGSFYSNSGPIYTTRPYFIQDTGSSTTESPDERSYPDKYSQSEERIREASQSSYYDSKPTVHSRLSSATSQIQAVDQNRITGYTPSSGGSQSSYYSENRETERRSQVPSQESRVMETSRRYQPRAHTSSSSTQEHNYEMSSGYSPYATGSHDTDREDNLITQTTRINQPGSYAESSSSTQEEQERRVSSNYYPRTYDSRRPEIDNEIDERPTSRRVGSPTSNIREPGIRSGQEYEQETDSQEKERYDISPYDDVSEFKQTPDEVETRRVQFENYPRQPSDSGARYDSSRSYGYQHQPQPLLPQPDRRTSSPQHSYSVTNSSTTDKRVTTVVPSSWVETKTTWKYINGKLASETQYNKYFENGVIVDDETIQRTRDEMEAEGVNVRQFDLSQTELARYGPKTRSSTAHSQKHEIYQVQRFRDGQQIYDLNHERLFQDGDLVQENKVEKNEDDFGAPVYVPRESQITQSQSMHQESVAGSVYVPRDSQITQSQRMHQESVAGRVYVPRDSQITQSQRMHQESVAGSVYVPRDSQITQSQRMHQQAIAGGTSAGLYTTGYHAKAEANPRSYTRKHEVKQEEEFINGKKIYDLHHERKYEDGRLVHENKTELGPNDLGVQPVQHRDSLKDLLAGRTQSSIGLSSMHDQQRTADNILSTSCITCKAVHGGNIHATKSILSTLGLPAGGGGYGDASSYRHDVNIEEHYEDGKLVKGREDETKWVDGKLVDENSEHYFQGPTRTNLTDSLSSKFGLTSTVARGLESSGTAVSTVKLDEECSHNPCKNKGSCKTSIRGPICICAFGFKGTYCEEAYCPSRYCRYGGICTISAGRQLCSCREGYAGYRCSTQTIRTRIGVSG